MGVDMIWIGDDVGTQTRHADLAEALAALPQAAHGRASSPRSRRINPQLKVAYHSDGNIWPIIPDLIEIGLDVLNPIQPACMDPAELKRLYGDRLCFWGIDRRAAHAALRHARSDVRDEVLTRLQDHRQGRRADHRPDASRPARHAAGELLGDGDTITGTPYTSLRRCRLAAG